jgi:hypothetical protein
MMKMAVGSMEMAPGAIPRPGRVLEQRLLSPGSCLRRRRWILSRLGHPSVTSRFNKQFPCNNLKNLCEACQFGKYVRLPFCDSSSKTSVLLN